MEGVAQYRYPSLILKHIYAEMLYEFSHEDVKNFWCKLQIIDEDGRYLKGADVFRALWKGASWTHRYELFIHMRNMLYPFLGEKNITLIDFMNRVANRMKECSEGAARQNLVLLKPYFNLIFGGGDLRQILLKIVNELYKGLQYPGRLKLVGQNVKLGRRSDVLLFSWDYDYSLRADLDFANMVIPLIQALPEILGLPSYEEAHLLADYRDPKHYIPNFAIDNGLCYDGTRKIGTVVRFHDFAKQKGMVLDTMEIPDTQSILLDTDLRGSDGSIVLRSGCLYRAPVVLVNMVYDSIRKHHGNPLEILVDALLLPKNSFWNQIQQHHKLLLEEMEKVVEVVYHRESESITIENRHLVRSMPAKILRNVLREFTDSGRTDFENLEFKRDPDITLDSQNPNFEGRLNRLMQRLVREEAPFLLNRGTRGRFSFSTNVKIKFIEL
jgi:hypothetical protein